MTHQMKIETKIPVEKRISAKSGHTRKLPENKVEISEAHLACGAKRVDTNGNLKAEHPTEKRGINLLKCIMDDRDKFALNNL